MDSSLARVRDVPDDLWCDLHRSGHSAPSAYASYADYSFLTIGNLQDLPSEDLQFLDMQGCLQVPSRPILDEFIQQYFLHMHPLLPLVNEGEFWDTYSTSSRECTDKKKISLLVFQAILFSCCNVSFLNLLETSRVSFLIDRPKVCPSVNSEQT